MTPCYEKNPQQDRHQWLTPVILAWEAEIRRIVVQGQIVHQTSSPK
jgi:hypothetical protein